MILTRERRILAALLLSVVLLTTACTPQTPGRFDQAQQESSQQKSGQAVAKNATQGSKFNKFFPAAGVATSPSIPKRKKALQKRS